MYDISRPHQLPKFGRCELAGGATVYPLRNKALARMIRQAFERLPRIVPGVELNRFNLFHAHLVAPDLLLFHAFEYPRDIGTNLGFCQQHSSVSSHHPNYRKRNVLHRLGSSFFHVVPCTSDDVACTVVAAHELGSFYFLPEFNEVFFAPL